MSSLPRRDRTKNSPARILDHDGGSALIESAVVLPAFCTLLFGIFAFACACTGYCSAAYAVRQGAHFASYRSNTSLAVAGAAGTPISAAANTAAIVSAAKTVLFTPAAAAPTVSVAYSNPLGASPTGNYIGNAVTVSASWTQQLAVPGYKKTLAFSVQAERIIVR
jgi:Flp pilus assembly protein TadG